MQIWVTGVEPATGRQCDVLVDADDDADAGVVLDAVRARLGASSQAAYVDGRLVDPRVPIAESPLRDGCVVSLGSAAGCVPTEPAGIVELRVVSGRGAGVVHRLGVGEFDIGAGAGCAVRLGTLDHEASVVVANDGVQVRPAADAPVRLEGLEVVTSTNWAVGLLLEVGGVLVELARPELPDAALTPAADGVGLAYNRPPRLHPAPRTSSFRLPVPPKEADRRPLPILMALLPLVAAVAMALVMQRMYFLLFGILSPISLLGNYVSDRRHGRRSHRKRLAEYRLRLARTECDIADAVAAEQAEQRSASSDPAALLLTAVGPRRRLWERRRRDDDFLSLRVGTAGLASAVSVEDPSEDEHRRSRRQELRHVPAVVSLRAAGVVGVTGEGVATRALLRTFVTQVAVNHSPRDVQLYVLVNSSSAHEWAWVRWLPHVRPALGQDALGLVGCDNDSVAVRIAELVALVTQRRDAARADTRVDFGVDVVVILDGARRLRSIPGLAQVLLDGPSVGIYVICADAEEQLLPEECSAVVTVDAAGAASVRETGADPVRNVRADLVSVAWAERVARSLAPIRDTSAREDDTDLPDSSRLLDILGLATPAGAITAGWEAGGRTTSFVIGEGLDGPLELDLTRDGPHALIAGTTGSGKSELLKSIVASLAINNRPDAMSFVLVDYKGGSAFKDCVALPHTVGMVTDLDAHLVRRALASLAAELRRREHVFATAGAKDIEDYTALVGVAPLARLVIVIDEFASLARELPDFVSGLVNIAQRGRSLGIHLILATQRPSGVVSPEIRANTNLRIALRVTDASESSDVLDAPHAAHIAAARPGRAYVRRGHGSLVPFQTGRVGGREPRSGGRIAPVVTNVDLSRVGRPPARRVDEVSADGTTDLSALVAAIRSAAEVTGQVAAPSPWLPPLPGLVAIGSFSRAADDERAAATERLAAPFGLEDFTDEQTQRPAMFDLATAGHLLVAGAPRSGRSQVLRTLAGSIGSAISPSAVHMYGLDCGNGALLALNDLPHCGAVVMRTEVDRVRRLLQRLTAEVARRNEAFAAAGVLGIAEQRARATVADRLPHLVLLLDRWEGFTSALGDIDGGALTELVLQLLREGPAAGLHCVITGERSLLSGRIATMADDRLVLRLADRGDYALAGLNPRSMPEEIGAGRAFRVDSGREVQLATLDGDSSASGQADAVRRIATDVAGTHEFVSSAQAPFRVDVLPALVSFAAASRQEGNAATSDGFVLAGVGGDELGPRGFSLRQTPAFVIAGPARSGRSTTLLTIAASLIAGGARLVIAAPRPSPLRTLAGHPSVLACYETSDIPAELATVLDAAQGQVAVLIDDAELLKECSARDVLRDVFRHGVERMQAVILAGSSSEICTGFSGWQVDAKRARHGLLLSRRDLGDGELIGARLPRSAVGGSMIAGRGLLHCADGDLVTIQVPLSSAADVLTRQEADNAAHDDPLVAGTVGGHIRTERRHTEGNGASLATVARLSQFATPGVMAAPAAASSPSEATLASGVVLPSETRAS